MKAYQLHLTILLLGVCAVAAANDEHSMELETELLTYSDWQISRTRFCPEDPVVIFAGITNTLGKTLDLRLVPGDSNRALVRISDSSGDVVWDTDEWDRIEEQRHFEQHGVGRILAGPGTYQLSLEPGASAFWISRWEQRDLAGDYVDPGEYLIEVSYRYLHVSDEVELAAIRVGTATVLISEQDCE